MHGTGNDFIILENLKNTSLDYPTLAKSWCNRHFGVGADGLILILPSSKADFQMRIFNADGSESEMCGNGIRCFARHVVEKKLINKPKFRLETLAGTVEPECLLENGNVKQVRINMGLPRYGDLHPLAGQPLDLNAKNLMVTLELPEGKVQGATISMGNPHYVIFPTSQEPWNLKMHGEALCFHKSHPHQSNIEFVKIKGKSDIQVDIWERGVGPTLACGSGACASVAAGRILNRLPEKVLVEMPGGAIEVEWDGKGPIFLTGPATYVYEADLLEISQPAFSA